MLSLPEKLRELTPYDPKQEPGMIRLDANESFLPLPGEVLEEAAERLRQTEFNRYPDPAAGALCRAFAAYYKVPVEMVTAGNGSDELITVLFTAFLEKGDAYATVEPDFSMYAVNGLLQEARHVALPKQDFHLDIDKMIETCNNENVKLLIFSNPCNPTSIVCPKGEIRRLITEVNALVVLDEAYMDFSDQSLLSEVEKHDNLVILRTCSKAVGMAALRLGFAVANPALSRLLRAVKSPYNVNGLSQAIGMLVLERRELLQKALACLLESHRALLGGIQTLGREFPGRFRLLPGEANFCALVLADGKELYQFLWNEGIAVRYTGGLVRVTCGAPAENEAFLKAFRAYLQGEHE